MAHPKFASAGVTDGFSLEVPVITSKNLGLLTDFILFSGRLA
jgi:hypothetical protein